MITSLIINSVLENFINLILYKNLKPINKKLNLVNKVLNIKFKEISYNLILLFNSNDTINILNTCTGKIDYTIIININELLKFNNNYYLFSNFIKNKYFYISGDINLIIQFFKVISLVELDFKEFLSLWLGDRVTYIV